jgi:peptidoglycan/xylan/chitin deacetylase (PgdA/CDA1 family)
MSLSRAQTASVGARPWRPAPAIVASAGLHAGAAVALALAPSHWRAVAGAVLANHALLTAAGLWPRSRLLGPNLLRLPPAAVARQEVALTIDDGPDHEVTPRLLELLDRRGAKASFFSIGERARAYPELCREIVRRGHSVENHTQCHPHRFALLGMRGFEREIAAAQETLAEITGQAPRFFRAPAGLRNPFLDPVLARLGLRLASWTRRGFDTVTRDPDKVARRLLRGLGAGDILLLHDGHAARTGSGAAVVLEALPRVLDALQAHGLRSVTLPAGTA